MNREHERSESSFGSMDEQQREVGSKGGKAAHEKEANELASDDTPEVGRSGGQSRRDTDE